MNYKTLPNGDTEGFSFFTTPMVQPCSPAEDGVCEALECCKDKIDHWRNNADCERQRADDANALLRQALYLIEAWERGAEAYDYPLEIAALRERLA